MKCVGTYEMLKFLYPDSAMIFSGTSVLNILVMDVACNEWLVQSPSKPLVAKSFGINPLSVLQWNLLIRTLENVDTCIIHIPSCGPK